MKIGVDIRVLMDKNYSGISEYTAQLLDAILRQDNINDYRLFYNSWHDLDGRLGSWRRQNTQIISTRWPNKIFNYILQKTLFYPRLDKLLGDPDIFWSPHFNFTSLEPSTKSVVTVHDLSFLRYPEYFSVRKNFWHRALGIKNILHRARAIVAVSENTRNDIIELIGISPDKVRVIYSGNNLPVCSLSADEKKELVSRQGIQGRFILYVGNIEPRKNIAGLIKAFDILKKQNCYHDLELVLAGAPGWKDKEIYRTWQQSINQAQINFIGYIDQPTKEALYALAVAFSYPSFYEGFGFPPLEAMARGCPVVCSNVSSLPEVVGNAALLINPDRPEEIAQALSEVLSDKELAHDLSQAGQEQAKKFSWDRAAQQYLELFKSI